VKLAPSAAELIAMRQAIEIAQDHAAAYGPNPRVGCIILDHDGQYLAKGFHLGAGHAHAEIAALESSAVNFEGSTAVVTLEPCFRPDRDQSCSQRLVAAGIKRVVIGQLDGSAKAQGGAKYLADNGVEVVVGAMADEAAAINPWFTKSMKLKRPYIRIKIAASLDGRIAAADGSAKWISGDQARNYVHQLRSEASVLVSSVKTAVIDQARFSARNLDGSLKSHQPDILLLGEGKLSADHPIFHTGNQVSIIPTRDILSLINELYQDQKLSILVEAGPTLATAFLNSGLVDEIIWVASPVLLGDQGIAALGKLGIENIEQAIRPHVYEISQMGLDTIIKLQFPSES
jgi:diaminohydroxyphosphoribosylaminopyrimidine deaminase / 5-amino-6-(5-phosphoribosylamino)uracil reductase